MLPCANICFVYWKFVIRIFIQFVNEFMSDRRRINHDWTNYCWIYLFCFDEKRFSCKNRFFEQHYALGDHFDFDHFHVKMSFILIWCLFIISTFLCQFLIWWWHHWPSSSHAYWKVLFCKKNELIRIFLKQKPWCGVSFIERWQNECFSKSHNFFDEFFINQ